MIRAFFSFLNPLGCTALAWAILTDSLGAEPFLRTVTLRCRDKGLICEVADTEASRGRGLMFRRELREGYGMLFVFPSPGPLSFWMKNTLIPLSIAYLDAKGVIQELHDLTPYCEAPVASRHTKLLYAIEVPQGWWRQVGIKAGDRVEGLSGVEIRIR